MLATADLETDHGPQANRSATLRMCAVSREVRPVDELIRFVVAPSGEVIADLKRKLPGRGLWISASRQAVAEAVRRHQFSRGFKRDVRAAPTLATDTEIQLERFVVEALAMAAKAGQVVSGFSRVAEIVQGRDAGAVRALIHASDGSADGIRKLEAMIRRNVGNGGDFARIPIVKTLASEQLDLALGRANVVHAALLAGAAGNTFLSRSQLLVRYRLADEDRPGAMDADRNSPL